MAISFNGSSLIISLSSGTTELSVSDLYSRWKDWILLSDNAKFPLAISAIGGDPISDTLFLGSTFFLENNWKIKPYEGNHVLVVTGNLFTRDGSSPFTSTDGDYNVLINMSTSNLINTVATGGGTAPTATQVASAVWNKATSEMTGTGTVGELVNKTASNVEDTQALIFAK